MKKKIKIAFLDRDGVINYSKVNNGYIGKIRDFKWIKGSKKSIKYLKSLRASIDSAGRKNNVSIPHGPVKIW